MAANHIRLTRIGTSRDAGPCDGEQPLDGGSASVGSAADLVLVRRCARQDADALREITQRHQQRLAAFLSRLLQSPEDTEEAVQDVFLRVWQQAGRFEGRASFTTWLYRIAANVAYDLLRRRKSQSRLMLPTEAARVADMADGSADAEAQALAGLEREERARQLQTALAAIRADDRLLLVLYYAEELGYDEICQITGHSYPVLKVRLLRARQRLRTVMERLAGEAVQ